MKIKTHKTAVVIIPPENLWQPIQEIRRQHDRHFRRWMPHITMIYPFRPREDFDELANQFYPVCGHFQPFPISFSLINQFQHPGGNFTLWLAPELKEPIIALQTALFNLVPDCNDVSRFKNGFTPHLSLGKVKGKSAMLKFRDTLQSDWKLLSFMLCEICFIWRNEQLDDVFRVSHRIKFDKFLYSARRKDIGHGIGTDTELNF